MYTEIQAQHQGKRFGCFSWCPYLCRRICIGNGFAFVYCIVGGDCRLSYLTAIIGQQERKERRKSRCLVSSPAAT